MRQGATHCKHGHPWTKENIYTDPRGEKLCRECKKQRNREHMRKQRKALRAAGLSAVGLNLEPGWRRHHGLEA